MDNTCRYFEDAVAIIMEEHPALADRPNQLWVQVLQCNFSCTIII
jgi:hypothetical protein